MISDIAIEYESLAELFAKKYGFHQVKYFRMCPEIQNASATVLEFIDSDPIAFTDRIAEYCYGLEE
jgi:hypothetical protein